MEAAEYVLTASRGNTHPTPVRLPPPVLEDMESLQKSRVEGVSAAIGGGPPIARRGGPAGAGAPVGGPGAGNSAAAQPIVRPGGPTTAARLSAG